MELHDFLFNGNVRTKLRFPQVLSERLKNQGSAVILLFLYLANNSYGTVQSTTTIIAVHY